jgi:hypothetical protein
MAMGISSVTFMVAGFPQASPGSPARLNSGIEVGDVLGDILVLSLGDALALSVGEAVSDAEILGFAEGRSVGVSADDGATEWFGDALNGVVTAVFSPFISWLCSKAQAAPPSPRAQTTTTAPIALPEPCLRDEPCGSSSSREPSGSLSFGGSGG